MSDIEKIEMARYHHEVVDDVRHMVGKYCRIMEWDVPDVDEGQARALILASIKAALTQVAGEK
jgi:hypothetical protein